MRYFFWVILLASNLVAGCASSGGLVSAGAQDASSYDLPGAVTDPGGDFLTGESPNIDRWFEIDRAKFTLRNATYDEFDDEREGSSQYRFQLDGHIKLDEQDRYSINFGLSTGRGRNGNWNDFSSNPDFALKGLSFQARPVDGLSLEFGSLGHTRSTVVKSFDADTYIVGGRASLAMPDRLYFDDISLTVGYAGDLDRPSAFDRLDRFGEVNFKQLVLSKSLNDNTFLSLEYSDLEGSTTLRQSVSFVMPDSKFLNLVSFKLYEPVDTWPEIGYSVYGEKNITDRFTLGGGYASIVADGIDTHGRGFALGRYRINDYTHLVGFYTESIGTPYDDGRFDLFLSFDLLKMFDR